MASDTSSQTFEDIDLDATSDVGLDRRALGFIVSLVAMAAVFVYDYVALEDREALFEPNILLQDGWDITQLDWLTALSLVVMLFYAVVPLATNRRMTRYYWREFKKNTAAVVGLGFVVTIFVIGLVGPLIVEQPEVALTQSYQPPVGFSITESKPLTCIGEVTNGRCHGSMQHPLGTTAQGKDIVALIVLGMRVSIRIGLITSLLIVTIGASVGMVSAYVGGLVDEVLMRYVDIQQVFPAFLLYILLLYLFGGSLLMFILVFGFLSWGGTARLIRSASLQRRESEYVLAAKSAGANTYHIIRRHLLPNVSSTVITNLTLLIPSLILFEAGLAFLSLGDPTVPSWGQVIAAGRSELTSAWWISTVPGFFLFFTILALNFIGDALRDALDPRSTGGES